MTMLLLDAASVAHIAPPLASLLIVFVFTPLVSLYISKSAIPTYRRRHHLYEETAGTPSPHEQDLEAYSKYAAHIVGTLAAAVTTLVGLGLLAGFAGSRWINWFAICSFLCYLLLTLALLIYYIPFRLHAGDYNAPDRFRFVPGGTVLTVFVFGLVTLVLNAAITVLGSV